MDSMYKGKTKFDREQLIFLVDASIAASVDRIESALPPSLPIEERKGEPTIPAWENSTMETCGMFLGILYAQLTGDGLGIGDAIDFKPKGQPSIRKFIETFIAKRLKNSRAKMPDSRKLATAWVDFMFKDYL